jgi:hypothetical protein
MICEGCKHLKPCAKATVNGIEYGFVCTANEKTFVDISELVKMNMDNCIDFEEKSEEDKLQLALEVKDIQKIAIQFNELNKEGEE